MSDELSVYADSKKSFEEHCLFLGYSTELCDDGFYVSSVTQRLFNAYEHAWQASRAALVVTLPDSRNAWLDKQVVHHALDEAGVSYK